MKRVAAFYELDEPLGEGGFGSVYRAIHRPTGLAVAIKLLRRADPDSLRMLLAEATAVAKVRHPHVAQLLDVGRTPEGIGFLVMELVRGHDFELWLRAWPGWPKVARALLEMLDGLTAVHAAGVVHRDLKPPNLLLDERDGSLRIVDFGIATVLDPLEESGENVIAGTPEFMAPEQLAGLRSLGPWTDLYAFGVLLHHVVRGTSPFDDSLPLPRLLAAKQAYVPAHRPARVGLRVPPVLDALIDALLSPDVRARPRFAAAVRDELASVAPRVEDRTEATPVRPRPMPSTPPEVAAAPTLVVGYRDGPENTESGSGHRPAIPDTRATPSDTDVARRSFIPALARIPASEDPRLTTSLVRLRDLPLVARDLERATLEHLIGEVRATSDVRLLVLLGEPGIGKSRLARWGLAEVERRGAMQGTAVAYELDGIGVGGGLGHLLARLVGIPEVAEPRAHAWLEARDPQIDLARLRALLAPTHATLPPRGQVVELARRVLRAASRDAPVYVWMDDLGWAHDGGIELVRALVQEGGAPILIVATLRASTAEHTAVQRRLEGLTTHPRCRTLTLEPLGLEGRRHLATHVAPLSPRVADELAASMDGSPLLLVQLIYDWIETGRLIPSSEGLILAEGRTFAEVLEERPPTRALDARIERVLESFGTDLGRAEGILLRAALLGASFEEATLLRSCGDDALRGLVPEVLDRALLSGILRADDGALGFEHGLVQQNLIERLEARGDRRAILFDTTNGLQASFGKDRADVAYAVAVLLRRAGRADDAWGRLLHAIDRAAWTGDVATATAYLGIAAAWNDADVAAGAPSHQASLELSIGRTHYMASRYDEAMVHLAEARRLASESGRDVLTDQSDALMADVAYYQGRYRDAERLASSVLARTEDSEDPDVSGVAAVASHRLSEIAVLQRDLPRALAIRRACREHARRSGVAARERLAGIAIAEIAVVLGDDALARAELEAALRAAEVADDVDHRHAVVELMAFAELFAGRTGTARFQLQARLRSVEALGEAWRITGLRIGVALASVLEDDVDEVRHVVSQMIEAFDVVAHDGPIERHAMEILIGRLRERGLGELGDACQQRFDARTRLAEMSLLG